MSRLMVCPNCGGPLPSSVARSPFVACAYCHATLNVEDRTVTKREAASNPDEKRTSDEERLRAMMQFHAAFQALKSDEAVTYGTFRNLCEQHLGPLGVTESVARVAYNLALDAEDAGDVSLRTRGDVLLRLAEGYMKAVAALRDQPRFELALPFLFATPEGPRHYSRVLDVPTIIALSEREVIDRPAPKGLWAKLFGG